MSQLKRKLSCNSDPFTIIEKTNKIQDTSHGWFFLETTCRVPAPSLKTVRSSDGNVIVIGK